MICECHVYFTDAGVQHITIDQDQLECLKLNQMKQLTNAALDCVRSDVLSVVDLKCCSGCSFKGTISRVTTYLYTAM